MNTSWNVLSHRQRMKWVRSIDFVVHFPNVNISKARQRKPSPSGLGAVHVSSDKLCDGLQYHEMVVAIVAFSAIHEFLPE